MMKINQLKAGAILSYISMSLGYIISILYTPIMLRLLGQSEYGLYNLVSSVVSYLGLLSFGFGSAYVRYYSRYKVEEDEENIAKLNGMFLIVFSFIGLVSIFAGIALVKNTEMIFGNKLTSDEISTAKVLMGIMIFNMAISFPASVFNSYITANEQYIFQKIVQIIKTVISPFVTLPILLMGYKSTGMVIVTTILNILAELANIIFCLSKLNMKFSFSLFDFSLMKEMTVFSSYIFMNMLIDQINWNVDKFLLGRFRGTVSVAIYGLAAQLNSYYLSLSTAISNVFIPRVNRMVAKDNDNVELTFLFTKVGRIQFILLSLICSGFIFFGRPFINMWAGNNYDESYYIALFLIVPVTVPLIQNLGIEIQRAKNMHQFRSKVYLLIAIINVIISIPMAKAYGGIGAAAGTSISLVVGNILIMNWFYHSRIGLDMKYFWKEITSIIKALVIPITVGILMIKLVDLYNIKRFLICASVYVIVFSVSMWFLGMNEYEKNLLRKPI
ncbi:oligosaccharide flippase family protein [Thermoclostridium stercorarium]|nr:oligosaccharide flippase family protein [Thermoclostridium stercorarium]